ncbi:MAG: hypothetical protein U1E52_18965 [Geminicoccaceae bacterium]
MGGMVGGFVLAVAAAVVGAVINHYLLRRLDAGLDVRLGRAAVRLGVRLVRALQGGLIGGAIGYAIASTWLGAETWQTLPGVGDQGSPLTEGAPVMAPEPMQTPAGTRLTTTGLEVILVLGVAGMVFGAVRHIKGAGS